MKNLVNIQKVARALGRSVKTVRRRVANGQIPAIQEGGRGTDLRFDLDDVIEAIKSPPVAAASAQEPTGVDDSSNERSQKRSGPTPKWKKNPNKQKGAAHG